MKIVSPQKAWKILNAKLDAVLVDVRSSAEFIFVGHPIGAINIPWIEEPDWLLTPNFVSQIQEYVKHRLEAPIILICRSGHRSQEAAVTLSQAGFTNVYSIAEGFEGELDGEYHRSTLSGWRFEGLPWEQC